MAFIVACASVFASKSPFTPLRPARLDSYRVPIKAIERSCCRVFVHLDNSRAICGVAEFPRLSHHATSAWIPPRIRDSERGTAAIATESHSRNVPSQTASPWNWRSLRDRWCPFREIAELIARARLSSRQFAAERTQRHCHDNFSNACPRWRAHPRCAPSRRSIYAGDGCDAIRYPRRGGVSMNRDLSAESPRGPRAACCIAVVRLLSKSRRFGRPVRLRILRV